MHAINIQYLSKLIDTLNSMEKNVSYEVTEEDCSTTNTYNIVGLRILLDNTFVYLFGKFLAPVRIVPVDNIINVQHAMSGDEESKYKLGYKCEISLTNGVLSIQA